MVFLRLAWLELLKFRKSIKSGAKLVIDSVRVIMTFKTATKNISQVLEMIYFVKGRPRAIVTTAEFLTRQLSTLHVWEDNLKVELKIKKNSNPSI